MEKEAAYARAVRHIGLEAGERSAVERIETDACSGILQRVNCAAHARGIVRSLYRHCIDCVPSIGVIVFGEAERRQ